MNKLILVDSHAILHRAFHALPLFTAPDGTPTNALHGFMGMLLSVLEKFQPTHLVVAFDMPGPNFRQQIYTAYQGKRPDVSGSLITQFPLAHELLDNLHICNFGVTGYEADDILGSLAAQAVHSSRLSVHGRKDTVNREQITDNPIGVIIVTGDRDMLQLVNKTTNICFPIKGFSEYKVYDQNLMMEEFGVTPTQWVDVKALKGDASDNYSGVEGIGPKTAEKLIKKYGNLEELYRNLSELEPKLARKLAEGAEAAGLGKKLAAIVTDVPAVKLDLNECAVEKINWEAGTKYMRERLGFKTIVERITTKYVNKTPLRQGFVGQANQANKTSNPNKTSKDSEASKNSKVNTEKMEQLRLI